VVYFRFACDLPGTAASHEAFSRCKIGL
jgi:hypothetical protein